MKPRVLKAEEARPGFVLSRGAGGLQKGAVLTAEHLEALRGHELQVIEIEQGEVHEDEAGRRLARAACGDGVKVLPPAAGNFPLAASVRGLVRVDEERLAAINQSDETALITLPPGQVVAEEELVGRAKIIPFVASAAAVERAEAMGAVLRVVPFRPLRVFALVQDGIDDAGLEKFRAAFAEKLGFFRAAPPQVARGGEVRDCIAQGAQLVILAGSKLMDPLDPAARALAPHVEKFGVPIYPGVLLWLAYVDGVPVVGAPGCALFSKATAFDVLLPLLMTGEKLARAQIARLGAGGLHSPWRAPAYRPDVPRGALSS